MYPVSTHVWYLSHGKREDSLPCLFPGMKGFGYRASTIPVEQACETVRKWFSCVAGGYENTHPGRHVNVGVVQISPNASISDCWKCTVGGNGRHKGEKNVIILGQRRVGWTTSGITILKMERTYTSIHR